MTLPDWLQPLPNADEQRRTDAWAIDECGIPGDELMAHAGDALANAILTRAPRGRIAIVCGKGNNGGDGNVAAGRLRDAGREVRVTAPGETPQLDGAAVVVDALLGTGASGTPRGPVADAIAAINAYKTARPDVRVFACDVPSGVDPTTGEVPADAVRADVTVTFHSAAAGLWINPGRSHAGEIEVVPIGIPDGVPDVDPEVGLITPAVIDQIPRRARNGSKFKSGTVLVLGGSDGLTGAPALASLAAARAGAGYVTVAAFSSVVPALQAKLLEVMVATLPDGPEAVGAALDRSGRADAVVLGPGLGRSEAAVAFARGVAARLQKPMLLDADGLNAFAGIAGQLNERAYPTVLTPHSGELARLLETTSAEIDRRRLHHVRAASALTGAVVVLKGDDSLVATPDGRVAVSPGGAPALATAGTGDVLSGVCGALLAKGMEPFTATCAAVLAHAYAGRLAGAEIGEDGVIASDVIDRLPRARTGQGRDL